jgi:cyclin-A
MADKENSSCAVSPPLTRAAAKRAATVTAVAVVAKRKRVALSAVSALPNAAFGLDHLHDDDGVKPAAKKHLHSAAEPAKRTAAKPNPKLKPAPLVVAEDGDPQLCKPYASDIYSYLRSMEVRAARSTLFLVSLFSSLRRRRNREICPDVEAFSQFQAEAKRRPATDYIAAVQVDVTANMRSILVDWLVEVAEEYKLVSDTLYLTVSYIDRFLSSNVLKRQKLQLLGVAAMLIAS